MPEKSWSDAAMIVVVTALLFVSVLCARPAYADVQKCTNARVATSDGSAVWKAPVVCGGAINFLNTSMLLDEDVTSTSLDTTMQVLQLRSEGSALHVRLYNAQGASLGIISFGGFSSSCKNRSETRRAVPDGTNFNFKRQGQVKE